MRSFLLHRILQFIPTAILASIGVWAMMYAFPGSPAVALAGADASPAQVAATARRLGLNRSVLQQYFLWVGHAVHLNLGTSAFSGASVSSLLASAIPASAQLALFGMVLGLLVALPIGALAAVRPRAWYSRVILGYEAVALAVPGFWVGLLLILALSIHVHAFPSASKFIPLWANPWGAVRNTLLPGITLALFISGIIARFVTAAMSEELRRDFVRTARAKGVSESRVVLGHAGRNALLPTVTVTGVYLGTFLGGTVVTEAVFNYPGLGRLVYTAVSQRDYAVIQPSVLFIVFAFLILNLIIDITYTWMDPRIRLS